MHTEQSEEQVSRRRFLKGAAVTAIAATATGAGAAIYTKQSNSANTNFTAAIDSTTAVPAAQTAVTTFVENPTELLTELAAAQAENIRLQTALAAAQSQLDTVYQSNQDTAVNTEALTLELESKTEQVGILAGLVALYEQLDEVDVPTFLENGVTAVSDTLTELIDDLPTLEEGIQTGMAALDEFEDHIPLLQNGRQWLTSQSGKLSLYFDAIEKSLEKAVDRITPFFEMLQTWFEDVQKWLPFGIGQKAVEVMASITSLLVETPHTINGLQMNLAEPLDVWFARDGEATKVQNTVLNPIRTKVMSKASGTIAKAQQIDVAYREQLVLPVETAVDRHRVLQNLITEYRETHQL
ncbi:MAG: twin-arginine translocation signal domain-containing protein [Chloroflexi bacterium]|nr:twin-arginine translocation signal domain-containing protein [Chloroflexota bacterium]